MINIPRVYLIGFQFDFSVVRIVYKVNGLGEGICKVRGTRCIRFHF